MSRADPIILIDSYMKDLFGQAKEMSAVSVAVSSLPGNRFDVKMQYPGHEGNSYHGFQFQGKYVTLREAGNMLAGANAASHGLSFDEFQKRAGALNAAGSIGLFRYEIFGTTYGTLPNYGENDYQRTRSDWGYYLYQSGFWPDD